MALYRALGPRQRNKAFHTVAQTMAHTGDSEARKAFELLMAISS